MCRGANSVTVSDASSICDDESVPDIEPFTDSDAVFDSALVYELSVLRVFAERYLLEVPDSHTSYATAFRLMHLLDRFVSIYPGHVPATSILREFVGGSGFDG